MYKVLIVDDEIKIAQWLAKAVPWAAYGFEVAEVCNSGIHAVNFIENNSIDLVITDIRMPGLNGLDLIKKLHSIDSTIHTIILSGYNQFEYAQQALKYGVRGFLLKPLEIDELIELLDMIRNVLHPVSEQEKTVISSGLGEFSTDSDTKIQEIFQYIEKNYNKDICLKTIAEVFQFHPAYLGKVFKEASGCSFNSYLNKKRIEKLKKLLVQSSLPINQLLESVGYHNFEYFYTIFKKYEGLSFSEYRTNLAKNT